MATLIELLLKAKDEASKVVDGVGKSVSGLGKVAAGIATGGLAIAGTAVVGLGVGALAAGSKLVSMTMDAAAVTGVSDTFDSLTASIGGSENAMALMRESTRKMVSNTDLQAAANKFLTMGITETAEETANMSEVATQLGLAMGTGPTKSMEDFALMMANQSIPRLDTFGISSGAVRARMKELAEETDNSGLSQVEWTEKNVKATQKLEDLRGKLHLAGVKQSEWTEKTRRSTKVAHAQRIRKITRQIAEQETALDLLSNATVGATDAVAGMSKEEAFRIAVMEQAAIAMKRVGEQGDNAAATTAKWEAVISNLTLGIGGKFVPVLETLRGEALKLAEKYGPQIIEWAGIAAKWLGEMLPTAVEWFETTWANVWPAAQAAVTDFWNAIQPGLEWIKTSFADFTTNILPGLATAWDILKGVWTEVSGLYDSALKPALESLSEALAISGISTDGLGISFGGLTEFVLNLIASDAINVITGVVHTMAFAFEAAAVAIALVKAVIEGVKVVVGGLVTAFEAVVGWIDKLSSGFQSIQLPSWLTPGSPTPLEEGLTGIASAFDNVPSFDIGPSPLTAGAVAGMPGGGGGQPGAGGGINIVNHFGAESVRSERDIMRIGELQEKALRLRGEGMVS